MHAYVKTARRLVLAAALAFGGSVLAAPAATPLESPRQPSAATGPSVSAFNYGEMQLAPRLQERQAAKSARHAAAADAAQAAACSPGAAPSRGPASDRAATTESVFSPFVYERLGATPHMALPGKAGL